MSGVAGKSGPPGNQNAAEGRRWTAALERSIERKGGKPAPDPESDDRNYFMRGVDALADDFISGLPLAGVPGYKELGDRFDGKAPQSIDAKVEGGIIVQLGQSDAEL